MFFHYKQTLERNARRFRLTNDELIKDTNIIINILGTLSLKYDGNINNITKLIDNLKLKYPSHFSFLDYYISENFLNILDQIQSLKIIIKF